MTTDRHVERDMDLESPAIVTERSSLASVRSTAARSAMTAPAKISNHKREKKRKGHKQERQRVWRQRQRHRNDQLLRAEAKSRRQLLVMMTMALSLVAVQMTGGFFSFYDYGRRLCGVTYAHERDAHTGFWEHQREMDRDYFTYPRPQGAVQDTSVAYVVTLHACDDDSSGCQHDPAHAFYDAAAVLQHSLCEVHSDGGAGDYEDCTIYAIVHPNGVTCKAPDGESYDRVAFLEDLGYFVRIWGAAIGVENLSNETTEAWVTADAGVDEYALFNAWRIDSHDIVVLVDFSTLMFHRPDSLYNEFLANSTLQVMYTRDYATSFPVTNNMGINPGFFMFKPSNETFDELNAVVSASFYDKSTGWEGSGVTGFDCDSGSRGVLTYKFTDLNKSIAEEIDRCIYGNTNENPQDIETSECRDGNVEYCEDCRSKSTSEIFVAHPRTTCGLPWNCDYDENWDSETKPLCEAYHLKWFQYRLEFEQRHMLAQAHRNGTFHPDVFLGYCNSTGSNGYELMLPDGEDVHEWVPGPDLCAQATCDTWYAESCDIWEGQCKDNDVIRPCVAVIDESITQQNDTIVAARWDQFRASYPERPFCLLHAHLDEWDFESLHVPPKFHTDNRTTYTMINRDEGSVELLSDWSNLCGISELASGGIDFVGLFIDQSGSMTLDTVRASYDEFLSDLTNNGLTYRTVENGDEDWITPFMTTLV